MKKQVEKVAAKKPVDPRVEVARDVIALLRAKRIVATKMAYFIAWTKEVHNGEVDVQKLMVNESVTCEVCAKGALMVAFAMKHDKVKLPASRISSVHATNEQCTRPLLETFSIDQLEQIEAAFEGWTGTWRDEQPNNDARLRAIMRRIIANGGDFFAREAP